MTPRRPTARDFRLAGRARRRYGLDDLTLAPDPATARTIAARIAAARRDSTAKGDPGDGPDVGPKQERAVTPGELQAAGILVEILGRLIDRYRDDARPDPLGPAAGEAISEAIGEIRPIDLEATIRAFPLEFPRRLAEPEPPDADGALAQLVLLGVLSDNPAVAPFADLVDLRPLTTRAARAARVRTALEATLGRQPAFPGDPRSLIELLREPAQAAPGSLADQLRYIRAAWGDRYGELLGDLIERLLIALDVLAEEKRAAELAWLTSRPGGLAGQPDALTDYGDRSGEDFEFERFSSDTDWMPSLVLMAKSTYVWLDQLSQRYRREIATLDAIPDEELAILEAQGITGLWLIGLWERSRASARIKQLRGQPDAVASAYSLDDYVIAADLGGPAALADLRERAGRHGIRLASDMVPNHMGIDSRWVIEHPERFLSLAESPFPAYSFNGPDLSDDERVSIRIEDHYYDARDAAVVFQRLDRATGEVRYVYHGNDGTSFPWNDTAQLDYSKAEVREAVIGTIVSVARQFPVIRFDAAMVLVKRHIERLWFPEPGTGGAIPSRAGHGLSRRAFEALMPEEFWREVVDRVAAEAPGTLLLAEAFWLLEGYFVRTLGMHRVYNSAFMNMLRDEKNGEYRRVMRNTLEFDPAILGRFVNFMSNPDEKTAVEQFGTGDKYFAVAALLVTLPGLPMFGHGQVDGFHEQYGMEFRRARLDEPVDEGLLTHHGRTIFPLLHRRAEFAGSEQFRLYDFETDGAVNDDVFAYSNRGPAGERSLVLVHNRYAETSGAIRRSVAYAGSGPVGERVTIIATVVDGLDLTVGPGRWIILRDAMSGLEELRSVEQIAREGFRANLAAYGCRVYVDLREVVDEPGQPWSGLGRLLAGRTVSSVTDALADLVLAPEQEAVRARLAAVLEELPESARARPAAVAAALGAALGEVDIDRLRLSGVIRASLAAGGPGPDWISEAELDRWTDIARALAGPGLAGSAARPGFGAGTVRGWFEDPAVRQALRVHRFDGAEYFEREAWEDWLAAVAAAAGLPRSTRRGALVRAASDAGYNVAGLLSRLSTGRSSSKRARRRR